jgi:hypothetical protein
MGRSVICGFLGSCFDAAEGAAAGGCWAYGGGDAMMEEEEEEMAGREREIRRWEIDVFSTKKK